MTSGTELMTPEEAIENLRALLGGVAGVDKYEIFIRRLKSLEVRSKNQELSALRERDLFELALRLQKNSTCVVSSSSDLSKLGLKTLIQNGRALLRASQQGPSKKIVELKEVPITLSYDGCFDDVPVDEKVSRVVNMTANTVQSSARYLRDVKATYWEQSCEEWLWTPQSEQVLKHKSAWAKITARALQEKTEGSKGFEASSFKTQYFDLDWSGVARLAAEGANSLYEARSVESGTYPALIDAAVVVPLLEKFSDALRGDRLLTGRSFFEMGDLNKKLFHSSLNIHDDPERSNRPGYRMWDLEGNPTRRQAFVEEGVLKNFAFDHSAGWSEGHPSNNQAVRPYVHMHPRPGFHSLSLQPDSKDTVDLRRELNNGLWIRGMDSFSLLQQGTGEFVASFSGVWLKNGEISHGLTRILVLGDLKSLFSKIVSLARDMAWSEHFGAPSVLVSELDVIGARN